MFWYDLFLLISAAAQRMHADRRQGAVLAETVTALTETLVEVSEFTVPPNLGGDITKRNFEALGNTLWAFWSHDLVDSVQGAASRIGSRPVEQFVEETLVRVRKLHSTENA